MSCIKEMQTMQRSSSPLSPRVGLRHGQSAKEALSAVILGSICGCAQTPPRKNCSNNGTLLLLQLLRCGLAFSLPGIQGNMRGSMRQGRSGVLSAEHWETKTYETYQSLFFYSFPF